MINPDSEADVYQRLNKFGNDMDKKEMVAQFQINNSAPEATPVLYFSIQWDWQRDSLHLMDIAYS